MCLLYKAPAVACICIHVACQRLKYKIEPSSEGKEWFYYVDRCMTSEVLESLSQELLTTLENCLNRLRRRVVTCSGNNAPGPPTEEPPAEIVDRVLHQNAQVTVENNKEKTALVPSSIAVNLQKEVSKKPAADVPLTAPIHSTQGIPNLPTYHESKERLSEQKCSVPAHHMSFDKTVTPDCLRSGAQVALLTSKNKSSNQPTPTSTAETVTPKLNATNEHFVDNYPEFHANPETFVPPTTSEKSHNKPTVTNSQVDCTSTEKICPHSPRMPPVVTLNKDGPHPQGNEAKYVTENSKGSDSLVLLTTVDQPVAEKKNFHDRQEKHKRKHSVHSSVKDKISNNSSELPGDLNIPDSIIISTPKDKVVLRGVNHEQDCHNSGHKRDRREKHKRAHSSVKDKISNNIIELPGDLNISGSTEIFTPKDRVVPTGVCQDSSRKKSASKGEYPVKTPLKTKSLKPNAPTTPTVTKPTPPATGLILAVTEDKPNAGSSSTSHKAERASRKRDRSANVSEQNTGSSFGSTSRKSFKIPKLKDAPTKVRTNAGLSQVVTSNKAEQASHKEHRSSNVPEQNSHSSFGSTSRKSFKIPKLKDAPTKVRRTAEHNTLKRNSHHLEKADHNVLAMKQPKMGMAYQQPNYVTQQPYSVPHGMPNYNQNYFPYQIPTTANMSYGHLQPPPLPHISAAPPFFWVPPPANYYQNYHPYQMQTVNVPYSHPPPPDTNVAPPLPRDPPAPLPPLPPE